MLLFKAFSFISLLLVWRLIATIAGKRTSEAAPFIVAVQQEREVISGAFNLQSGKEGDEYGGVGEGAKNRSALLNIYF